MFSIKMDDIRKLESELVIFNARALPFATKATLNNAAFGAQKTARSELHGRFILRNRYTERSIQVDQARTLNIDRQKAVIGSTASYMEDQEFGGTKSAKGKQGVPIPTTFSAGENEGSRKRTRLPQAHNMLKAIQLASRGVGSTKNKRQRLLRKVQIAVQSGSRVIYANLSGGRKRGIYRIVGGVYSGRGWPKGARIKLLYDLSKRSVSIPKSPWLSPAFKKEILNIPAYYKKNLEFQIKRNRIFK